MLDYKSIKCPKCGKSHFMETGYNDGNGSYLDLFSSFGFHDGVYREEAQPIYKDGELENPEAFTPKPTEKHFKCVECDCNFYVKTTWEYNKEENKYIPTDEIVDKDKEEAERIAIIKKHWEEQEAIRKKREAENAAVSTTDKTYTVNMKDTPLIIDSPLMTKAVASLGEGDKSEIDLGGTIINSTIAFTEDQIKNIKTTFGWDVKNK